MAISRQALDQVRNILRELDQRIDDARSQRTNDDSPSEQASAPSPGEQRAEHNAPAPTTPGRARPKRPSF